MAVKEAEGGKPWWQWSDRHAHYHTCIQDIFFYESRAAFWKFVQYIFYQQWGNIKAYANEKGVAVLGDMPIYVAMDSADVWSGLPLFLIDEKTLKPEKVAGVPPDYFSENGQLWGNPLYDWAAGMKLFDKVFEVYPNAPIIAEDLGVFGEDVVQLLADTGFPGMKVVQFGFDPNGDSSHMPHNAEKNSINYVGTHDNNTLLGWLWEAGEAERRFALDYAGFTSDNWGDGGYQSPACRKIIETVWRSASNVVIIALQDMCGFGSDARMNTPGVPEKNWRFRTTEDTIANIDGAYFRRINSLFRRTYPVFEK